MKTREQLLNLTTALFVLILLQSGCVSPISSEVFCFDDPLSVLHRAEYFIQSGKAKIEGGVSLGDNDRAKLKNKIDEGKLQLISIEYPLNRKSVTVNFLISDTLQPEDKIEAKGSPSPAASSCYPRRSYTYRFFWVRMNQNGKYEYSGIGETSGAYVE